MSSDFFAVSGTSPPFTGQDCTQTGIQCPLTLVCSACNQAKHPESFHKNTHKKTGRESQCKDCVKKAKAKAYKQRKKRSVARKKTNVMDVNAVTVSESHVPFQNDSFEKLAEEFIGAVLCKRIQK